MDPTLLTAIFAPLGIYILAVPMPGPGFIVITRASIIHGPANGAAAALGTTGSVSIYAVATALGISALLTALPWLTSTIQFVGGAYLIYIGVALVRASLAPKIGLTKDCEPAVGDAESFGVSFRRGLLVGLGNPKMAAFFLGLLAPAMAGDFSLATRLIVLGGVILIDLLYHQLLALVVARGRGIVGRAGRWFDAAVGGCMTAFGFALIARSFEES